MSLCDALTILLSAKKFCDLQISNCTATPDMVKFSVAVDVVNNFIERAVSCLMRFSDH